MAEPPTEVRYDTRWIAEIEGKRGIVPVTFVIHTGDREMVADVEDAAKAQGIALRRIPGRIMARADG